jgi:hypothetical protein
MSASEARILANQANAARSTGPRTVEGKAKSRANAYKHGLTGAGVVVSDHDAAKIEQLTSELKAELLPSTTTGSMLVERMAVLAVRMERSVAQENAAIAENVRLAEADFEAPEGMNEAIVAKLRREAGQIALFDPSKEATLARKYEAAAERGFFRALKELRLVEKERKAANPWPEVQPSRAALGSFLPGANSPLIPTPATAPAAAKSVPTAAPTTRNPVAPSFFEVPFAIGKAG